MLSPSPCDSQLKIHTTTFLSFSAFQRTQARHAERLCAVLTTSEPQRTWWLGRGVLRLGLIQARAPPAQPLHAPPGSAAHVPEPRGRAGTALTCLVQVARTQRSARTAAAARDARRHAPRAPPPKADPGRAHACPALRACVGMSSLTCWVQVGGFFSISQFHHPSCTLTR